MADRIRKRRQHYRRMAKKRRKRAQVLFGLVLACAVLAFGITYFTLYRYVSKFPQDVVCENIYIGTMNASGMTREEVLKGMEAHLKEDQAKTVTLKVGKESAEATLEEFGIYYRDMEKTADKAVSYGKDGGVFSRYLKLRKLKKEKLVLDEKITVNEEKGEAILKERAVPIADHAKDAAISRTGTGFSIEAEQEGTTVDVAKSLTALEEYLNQGWKHDDFTQEMVLVKEEPKIKAADLETIQDELGSFSTDAGGGERWKNLETGSKKLNGTILMPGEEASVHDLTAPYDEEHGYVPAGAYENGQVVESYGGGICQVSTTLYNALLYAELEIVERYPHSMLVNYVEPSRDAAIAGDTKDLKFKNNLDTPIYIEGGIDDSNQLYFAVYGKETRDANRSVDYVSETLAEEEYDVRYEENPGAALGSMSYSGSPHVGKSARLWKVVSVDGKEVEREKVNESHYSKSDQVVKVGTKSDNANAAAAVRAAIATQDYSKIMAAISQAGGA